MQLGPLTTTSIGSIPRPAWLAQTDRSRATFHLTGEERGEALALATQAIGAISRDDLRTQVHDESGGLLSLDPAPTEDD